MVLGGAGLVGTAIARRLALLKPAWRPRRIIVASQLKRRHGIRYLAWTWRKSEAVLPQQLSLSRSGVTSLCEQILPMYHAKRCWRTKPAGKPC